MTQEEKQLLLKDLSARLPYGVKIRMLHYEIKDADPEYVDDTFSTMYYNMMDYDDESYEFLPYLRPMSSMTLEERKECARIAYNDVLSFFDYYKASDYLNSIHVDYRGLIKKGLAIEVTDENNPYKD